jgi:hypothetical protein
MCIVFSPSATIFISDKIIKLNTPLSVRTTVTFLHFSLVSCIRTYEPYPNFEIQKISSSAIHRRSVNIYILCAALFMLMRSQLKARILFL